MDPDGEQNKKIKRQKQKTSVLQRYVTNVSDVLSTSGLRCTIQTNDGSDRFVLGSYWGADVIFYSISGCFWLSYILLTKYLNKKETS